MKQVKDSSAEDSTSKTRLEKVKQMWIYTKMTEQKCLFILSPP